MLLSPGLWHTVRNFDHGKDIANSLPSTSSGTEENMYLTIFDKIILTISP